ncbi:MAG TPA: methyltransferase domain-containing protein [Sediminibacterium sp.]|nr:methyltransferase domain-containing protein [Sediminibacterium sp.]
MSATMNTVWNPQLYNSKHDFVYKYGEDLVHVLDPKAGERILDLGCGTGFLTNRIQASGANVVGIDHDHDMILKARQDYPGINFRVLSATEFHFDEMFDAIFSNAVLHWVQEKEQAIDCMYSNLKRNGRLVLEMGGRGNVQGIIEALKKSLENHQLKDRAGKEIWYFPSLGEYTSLLEHRGFRVSYAAHYNRETELQADGIQHWIRMFGNAYLQGLDESVVNSITAEAQDRLFATHYREGRWYADYKRLRIVAVKPATTMK